MKWIALVAVAACALVGSLYATAAPPSNVALRKQVDELKVQVDALKLNAARSRTRVKVLEARVQGASDRVAGLVCVPDQLWAYLHALHDALNAGQKAPAVGERLGCT